MKLLQDAVTIFEYDAHWPKQYEIDAPTISRALGGILVQLDHIGGTAIDQLASREIIDVLAQVSDLKLLEPLIPILEKLKFIQIPNESAIRTKLFYRGSPYHPLLLHVLEYEDPQAQKILRFKNYLSKQKKLKSVLSRAKKKLADNFRGDIHDYLKHRTALMQAIDIKALIFEKQKSSSPQIPRCPLQESEDKIVNRCLDNFAFGLHWPALFCQKTQPVRLFDVSYNISQSSSAAVNQIWNANFDNSSVVLRINEIRSQFSDNKFACTWWVTPRDTPGNLMQRVHREGFRYQETMALLYLQIGTKALDIPSTMQIVRVRDSNQILAYCKLQKNSSEVLDNYSETAPASYGPNEPIEYLLLYEDGKARAGIKLVYYASVVGLYEWASDDGHPNFALFALIQSALEKVSCAKWKHACLLSSEEDAKSFLELGFEPLTQIHRHVLPQKQAV